MSKFIWALLALLLANLSGAPSLAAAAENDRLIRQIAQQNVVDRSEMAQPRRQAGKRRAAQMPCMETSGPPCISMMPHAQPATGAAPEAAIPYESRGIGEDDPVGELAANYNLHMVFAARGSGEYLADIKVRIDDAKGKLILDVNSPGPIFFARLPAGSYRVTTTFHDQSERKSVTVQERGMRDLYFYWAPENAGNAAMQSQ